MRVSIPVEFEIESLESRDNDDEMEEENAKDAASMAIYHFLTFFTGVKDTNTVEVHVDGHGRCRVQLVRE